MASRGRRGSGGDDGRLVAKPSVPDESSYMLRDNKRLSHRERYRTAAPDGGWGWYVVSGCAFANLLLPGMLRSFGPDVLDGFVEIRDLQQSSDNYRSIVHWIPITFDLAFYVAGSLSCLLCEPTSHQAVTFWGGLLAFVGMMSTSFANSIPYLYISYGIMVGFGAGLCCPAGMLIVNEYFERRRGLANGLSLVGTTVGSVVLPPYFKFLTSSYGYRGGILIVSGMMLNILVCALIYEPVDEHVRMTSSSSSSLSSLSTTSINASRAAATTVIKTAVDEYFAAVTHSSSSSSSLPTPPPKPLTAAEDPLPRTHHGGYCLPPLRRRLFRVRPSADILAVSAVNAAGHLACAVYIATVVPLSGTMVALHLAAADAAGRVFVPAISDRLSSGGSASVYLYGVAAATIGTVLLVTGTAAPLQKCSSALLVAFGLASGAVAGLEPLVAVRALGHDRLSMSCAVTALCKGAAQLTADMLFSGRRRYAHRERAPLYAVGICLTAVACVWTAVFLCRRHASAAKISSTRYVRTA